MAYNANEVALWILTEAKRQGILMTHMKLQKLLYYAQAYSIAMTGEPLFNNDIQAWKHGPVVPDVYHSFRKYGNSIITDFQDTDIPENLASLIFAIIHDKGYMTAYELSNMTHNEPTWINARNNPEQNTITVDMLSDFFTQDFWASDEEDEFQPAFNSAIEEDKYFRSNITEEERNAIIASR